MANGATVRARDRATRDCAALTETLKKIDPARAIATMASPADQCEPAERWDFFGLRAGGAGRFYRPGPAIDRGIEEVGVPDRPSDNGEHPPDQRPVRVEPLSRALAPDGSHVVRVLRKAVRPTRLKCRLGAADAPYMAEFLSGSQPPPASPSPSSHQRLPQAQAENILASLAGRPTSHTGPARSALPPRQPSTAPPGNADQKAPADPTEAGHSPGPGPGRPKPVLAAGPAQPNSHPAEATVAKRARAANSTAGPSGVAAGAPLGAAPGLAGPYGNDILPAKPQSRFRFRLR